MASSIGVALVGAGNIAQSIHLPLLKKMGDVRLEAIVDRQVSKARALADRYNVAVATKSLDDVVRMPSVDAVVVTTSTDAHAEVALAAIAAGKHVFIERPAARTLAETLAIKTAADEAGVHVMVGMNHRFRTDVAHMKNAVDRGEIGPIFYVKAGWVKQRSTDARWVANAEMSGGGVLIDLGVSMVDMILHIFDFGRIHSVVVNTYHQQTRTVEDIAIAMLTFDSGSTATIEASWSLIRAEDLYYCNVFGKKGSAYINPFKLVKKVDNSVQIIQPEQTKSQLAVYKKSYETELRHFVSGARGIIPMISTIDEAVERMKIIEAMYASAELKREIVIP